jgi:hypothetical protein
MDQMADKPFDPNSKYYPLHRFLMERDHTEPAFSMSFSDIEEIIGTPLPPGARSHRAWWGNGTWGHSQSRSWLLAGWRAVNVEIDAETVEFILQTNARPRNPGRGPI